MHFYPTKTTMLQRFLSKQSTCMVPSCQPARRVAAALRRQQRFSRVLRPSVLRTVIESTAPSCARRRTRVKAPRPSLALGRRRVLHGLRAPVGKVLVVLELVGVVLENPELCAGCFSTFSGAPCTVSPAVVAPPALARHPCGQVLLQRLDAPVHHGNGGAASGARLRAAPCPAWQTVQVRRDHKVPVVPSSRAACLVARPTVLAFLFCRGSAASRVRRPSPRGRTSSSPTCSG